MTVLVAERESGDAPLRVSRTAGERAAALGALDRLVVTLPARSPVADFSLAWWTVDDEGRRAAGGHWPDPELEEALARPMSDRRVLAIAPADAVAIHWLAMPDLSPAQARVAAQLRIVDEAAAPPGELHVVAGAARSSDGALAVAAVDRAVMADWIAWCARHRIDPDHIVPAPLLLPDPAPGTVGHARIGDEVVFRGEDAGWASDDDLDGLLIGEDRVVEADEAVVDGAVAAAFAAPPLDLRSGPFAKRRRGVDGGLVRRVVAILIACGVVELLIALLLIGRASFAADALDAEALALAQPAVPAATAVEQLVPTLDAELARRGGGPNSFTVPAAGLYAALTATPAATVTELSYTPDGTLTANLSAPTVEQLNAVLLALQRDGFTVSYTMGQGLDGRQSIALTVRGSEA